MTPVIGYWGWLAAMTLLWGIGVHALSDHDVSDIPLVMQDGVKEWIQFFGWGMCFAGAWIAWAVIFPWGR